MSFAEMKYPSSIVVVRKDGTTYDLGPMGFHVKTFDPPSANNTHTFQQIGRHGAELLNSEAGQITIPLVLDITAYDIQDFELKRMKLSRIFSTQEEFYVSTVRMPYLRWKVIAEAFTMPQLNSYWKASGVTINLVCAEGYAESVGTTMDPFTYKAGVWGMGNFLPHGKDLKYKWNTSPIKIYNASTIPLLAEEHPVKITFKGDAPYGVTLQNKTTGQKVELKHQLTKENTLVWYGLVPLVDGKQRYGNTWSDHGYLDFATGWNELELTGSYDFEISFDTHFYY